MNIKLIVGSLALALACIACNGDENDPWARKWTIRQHTQPVIVAPGKEGKFKLQPVKKSGKVIYYTVEYQAGEMTDNWKGVILFPRGLAAFPTWPAAAQLLPFDAGQANKYKDAIRDSLIPAPPFTQKPDTNTQRLEGDIEVKMNNGSVKKEALTLYIVKGAVTDTSELLVVQLRDTTGGTVQDGSGNGDPK